MAVESRFVVIRDGAEVKTFMDKKSADEYDKMLDMADSITELLEQSQVELSDEMKEELAIFISKNREDVLIALQAKKPKPAKSAEKKVTKPKKAESGKEGELAEAS